VGSPAIAQQAIVGNYNRPAKDGAEKKRGIVRIIDTSGSVMVKAKTWLQQVLTATTPDYATGGTEPRGTH